MGDSRPLWRKTFDVVERRIAATLEPAVQTDQFADALALMGRLQHRLRRRVSQMQGRALHLYNVPALTDVLRLMEQVARLERRIIDLSKRLELEEDASDGQSPDTR